MAQCLGFLAAVHNVHTWVPFFSRKFLTLIFVSILAEFFLPAVALHWLAESGQRIFHYRVLILPAPQCIFD